MYRRVISLYPRSPQALGAIERLGTLGALELKEQMQALIDSAMVDTTGVVRPDDAGMRGASIDSLTLPPPPDTAGVTTITPDSVRTLPTPETGRDGSSTAPPDTTRFIPSAAIKHDGAHVQPPDSIRAVPPADTTGAREN